MLKKIIKAQVLKIGGKKKLQPSFENLLQLALIGMHIGRGDSVSDETSGEKGVVEYIARKCKPEGTITIFDVGANIGDYTILLDNVLHDKARIFFDN
ncbi:MAG: hypothetical protein LBU22_14305 [Dysgonamonadaceae bacterium]|jgi:hypothetical protein|nr:hypothetical protein [Dysgonamonadaceae bacterium]